MQRSLCAARAFSAVMAVAKRRAHDGRSTGASLFRSGSSIERLRYLVSHSNLSMLKSGRDGAARSAPRLCSHTHLPSDRPRLRGGVFSRFRRAAAGAPAASSIRQRSSSGHLIRSKRPATAGSSLPAGRGNAPLREAARSHARAPRKRLAPGGRRGSCCCASSR